MRLETKNLNFTRKEAFAVGGEDDSYV